MSSPNHPTSHIEDVFSLNFHDYFPATSGNSSPNSSNDFTKYLLATLVFSPLHDNLYMEVMQAYDATDNELPIPLLQTIIALPTLCLHLQYYQCLILEICFLPRRFQLKTLRLLNHSLWITMILLPFDLLKPLYLETLSLLLDLSFHYLRDHLWKS
nr:hypothetical protein [Tanacetum cinerariifolium]